LEQFLPHTHLRITQAKKTWMQQASTGFSWPNLLTLYKGLITCKRITQDEQQALTIREAHNKWVKAMDELQLQNFFQMTNLPEI
jgi:hypothetical protein